MAPVIRRRAYEYMKRVLCDPKKAQRVLDEAEDILDELLAQDNKNRAMLEEQQAHEKDVAMIKKHLDQL